MLEAMEGVIRKVEGGVWRMEDGGPCEKGVRVGGSCRGA